MSDCSLPAGASRRNLAAIHDATCSGSTTDCRQRTGLIPSPMRRKSRQLCQTPPDDSSEAGFEFLPFPRLRTNEAAATCGNNDGCQAHQPAAPVRGRSLFAPLQTLRSGPSHDGCVSSSFNWNCISNGPDRLALFDLRVVRMADGTFLGDHGDRSGCLEIGLSVSFHDLLVGILAGF